MIRGIPLLLFALLIDGLQATISLGVMSVSWIPILGQAGFAVALAISTCIAIGMGGALIVSTIFLGFSPWRLCPALAEVVPGVNILPVWTIATLWVIFWKEEKKGYQIGGTVERTLGFLTPGGRKVATLKSAMTGNPTPPRGSFSEQAPEKTSRAPILPQRNFDGIRSAVQNVALVLILFLVSIQLYSPNRSTRCNLLLLPKCQGKMSK